MELGGGGPGNRQQYGQPCCERHYPGYSGQTVRGPTNRCTRRARSDTGSALHAPPFPGTSPSWLPAPGQHKEESCQRDVPPPCLHAAAWAGFRAGHDLLRVVRRRDRGDEARVILSLMLHR